VARECVELGCMPLWLDVNEYSSIAREAGGYPHMVKPDWSNFVDVTSYLMCEVAHIKDVKAQPSWSGHQYSAGGWLPALQRVVRNRCSYEATTPSSMEQMGLTSSVLSGNVA